LFSIAKPVVAIFALSAVLVVLLWSPSHPTAAPAPLDPTPSVQLPANVKLGFGYWPTDMSESYQDAWFKRLQEAEVEILAVQISDPFEDSEYARKRLQWLEQRKVSGYATYIGFEPFSADRHKIKPAGNGSKSILDQTWRDAYEKVLLASATQHRPDYLNPCIEVNLWHDHASAQEWQAFRDFYVRIYDLIKAVSPATRIFCSLQIDRVTGHLYGDKRSQWQMFDDPAVALPKQDLLGISTYLYGTPDIDQWSGLRARAGVPLFIAEIGCVVGDTDYPMSEAAERDQQRLLLQLPAMLQGLELEGLLWITLADLDPDVVEGLPDWYYLLGLLDHDLTPKAAWATWQRLKSE
jgi:hypothetical protein